MPKTVNMLDQSNFNSSKFEADVRRCAAIKKWTMKYIGEELLVRSASYLQTCFGKKKIPLNVAMQLCKELGLKLSDYEIKPEPPKMVYMNTKEVVTIDVSGTSGKGWENTLSVNTTAGIVSLAFFKDGEKIASGRARIFGNTDHDIMQAISYAAHMCYKFSEQRELFNENRSNTIGGCACKTTSNTETTPKYRR